jgi:gamma-glutamylcyclotransferase
MPERLRYFAYGSNMSLARLRARVPSAQLIGMATLAGHVLRFHKPGSRDGSGKCDALPTGGADDRVIGALYWIDAIELPWLDEVEGVGHGYERRTVAVTTGAHESFEAQTYVATQSDARLRPLDWYKEHVLRGARALGLPAHYVAAIEAIAADPDADDERRHRELAIYR